MNRPCNKQVNLVNVDLLSLILHVPYVRENKMVSLSWHHCVFNLITVCYHISLCISQHLPCTAESLLLSNALPICAEIVNMHINQLIV